MRFPVGEVNGTWSWKFIPSGEEVKNDWRPSDTHPFGFMTCTVTNVPLVLRNITLINSSDSDKCNSNVWFFLLVFVHGLLKCAHCHYCDACNSVSLWSNKSTENVNRMEYLLSRQAFRNRAVMTSYILCSQHGNNYFMGCFSGCGNGRGCVEEWGCVCRNGR